MISFFNVYSKMAAPIGSHFESIISQYIQNKEFYFHAVCIKMCCFPNTFRYNLLLTSKTNTSKYQIAPSSKMDIPFFYFSDGHSSIHNYSISNQNHFQILSNPHKCHQLSLPFYGRNIYKTNKITPFLKLTHHFFRRQVEESQKIILVHF